MEAHALGDVFAETGFAPKPIVPLEDAQIQFFIDNGYVAVRASELSDEFHQSVTAAAAELDASGVRGWGSNDVFPIIPQLGEMLSEPHVHGALTGLLGRGYAMHPHRHCHTSPPGNGDQGIHQDSYEDDSQVRHCRPRWCMAMYYPQDVTPDLGPTAIVPGSHWYNDPHRDGSQRSGDQIFGKGSGQPGHWCHENEEYKGVVPPGTVMIVHYEMWHRATKVLSPEATRYSTHPPSPHAQTARPAFRPRDYLTSSLWSVFKFLVVRMEEPTGPSWNCAADRLPGAQDEWAQQADAKSLS